MFEPRRRQIGFFLLAPVSRPVLGSTLPPVSGVLPPGVNRGLGVTLTTHPHLVPRSRMSRSYTPLPPSAFVACSGTALAFRYNLALGTTLSGSTVHVYDFRRRVDSAPIPLIRHCCWTTICSLHTSCFACVLHRRWATCGRGIVSILFGAVIQSEFPRAGICNIKKSLYYAERKD
jgi:hypothetical protein